MDEKANGAKSATRGPGGLAWAALALAHAAAIWPIFFLALDSINLFDEAQYIQRGRALLERGELPAFGGAPAVALFYAPVSALFLPAPEWIARSCALGRMLLFALNWLAFAALARRLEEFVHPLVLAGLLIASSALPSLLLNSSDALFAGLSGLALASLLAFECRGRLRDAALGSGLMGLAALSRGDGFPLAIIFFSACLLVGFRGGSWRRALATLAAAVVPFLVVVGGWIGVRGLATGDFAPGLGPRAYLAFEEGEGYIRGPRADGLNPFFEGKADARELYGTRHENGHSIPRAIARNPKAFAGRLKRSLARLPEQFREGLGDFGAALLLLWARGALELARRRRWLLLLALGAWPLHLGAYFLTYFQPRYFPLAFAGLAGLGAVGLSALPGDLESSRARKAWAVALALLAAGGRLADAPWVFRLGLAGLAGGFAARLLAKREEFQGQGARFGLAAGAFALASFVQVHVPPSFPSPGNSPLGRAASEMARLLPEGSRVASYSPGVALAAGMDWEGVAVTLRVIETPEHIRQWLGASGVRAILMDDSLRRFEPRLWEMFKREAALGEEGSLSEAWASADGSVAVLLTNRAKAKAALDALIAERARESAAGQAASAGETP